MNKVQFDDLNLTLTAKNLTDSVLFTLAWKKAHHYVRSTNWYADNFELDKSALDLHESSQTWPSEINDTQIKFKPLKLVPAPKTQIWHFVPSASANQSENCLVWQPKVEEDKADQHNEADKEGEEYKYPVKLRPLAHIGIKEQTIMTLVMMCLANEVETRQGDPATDYERVHAKKIVSYGNRVYCNYRDDKAEYSYGATTVYSKFFQDYQKFLQRPYYFANQQLTEKEPDEEVYLVELDLRHFFDCVKRELLIEKINLLAETQSPGILKDRVVQSVLDAFEKWDWSEECKERFNVCKTDLVTEIPRGIPQGLVAGGFLANIYLLDFDRELAELTGLNFIVAGDFQLRIIDYCRYVDDMRLVLVGPKKDKDPTSAVEIKKLLKEFLNSKLKPLNLEINENKSKVEIYRGKTVGISKQLQEIQSAVSGPVSFEDAQEQLTQLENLLTICPQKDTKQDVSNCKLNRLADIDKSIFDVRDDTLRRFAANKISRTLNTIRHFTAREVDELNKPIPGDWDYLQERMARHLIALWSRDPSLVLLLKKGLELFPSTKLLKPVLEQFDTVFDYQDSFGGDKKAIHIKKQQAVTSYLLSEIFRHSASVIHKKDTQAFPAQADVEGYFETVQDYAVKVLNDPSASWLLKDQARFLLLVRLDTVLESSTGDTEHDLIFKLAKGFRKIKLSATVDSKHLAHSIIIASQLIDDQKALIRAVNTIFNNAAFDARSAFETLQFIAHHDINLIKRLVKSARALKQVWVFQDEIKQLNENLYLDIRPSTKNLNSITQQIGLLQLITREDNPFANEIMSLKLMQALLETHADISRAKGNQVIDLAQTKVEFPCGYSNPPKYDCFDQEMIATVTLKDSVFAQAGHSAADAEERLLQQIALVIRAALSGSQDVTGFGQDFEPKNGYRGVKSTPYKRQFGLFTTPQSLAGETAAFSSWLTTILSKLLKWPGIRVNDQVFDWPKLTLDNVKKLVSDRLRMLKANYCQLSQMPTVIETIQPDWKDKTKLTIAMVQSKLPHKADFTTAGLQLDEPQYRVKHRRHVARISLLVLKHIEAQRIEHTDRDDKKHHVDLIIWPELSVHPEDMDILKHLAQKTHSIVLAGLSFQHQHGIKGPINRAVWIVPKKHHGNQNELLRYQGKHHLTKVEHNLGVQSWRPYQLMIELLHFQLPKAGGFKLTAAICYDATDIKLSADLADKSNAFLIPALNTDVNSFDTMVEALHYHMYQPVVLVNTGEYGGSYAMAPYKERHHRLIAHSTGNDQIAINTFELSMFDFRRDTLGDSLKSNDKEPKTPPAGIVR